MKPLQVWHEISPINHVSYQSHAPGLIGSTIISGKLFFLYQDNLQVIFKIIGSLENLTPIYHTNNNVCLDRYAI